MAEEPEDEMGRTISDSAFQQETGNGRIKERGV